MVSVTDKAINMKERLNENITSLPYGMVVWSTGIGTRPIIMDFMKEVGQVCLLIHCGRCLVQIYIYFHRKF